MESQHQFIEVLKHTYITKIPRRAYKKEKKVV
jgi:hypothetical protein